MALSQESPYEEAYVKTIIASLAVALICITSAWAARSAVRSKEVFVPRCPQPTYNADGNLSPLFCVIDNPLALRHYAPLGRRTFALGPNASPTQVAAALAADYKRGAGTEPILCAVYRLAAWRNQWRFGVSPVSRVGVRFHFPEKWCSDPRFNVGS